MRAVTRRRLIRLYNNTGPLLLAAGLLLATIGSLAARGRL